MSERFLFTKVTDFSPEFHSKRDPLQLFFNKNYTRFYGFFLSLRVAAFQNLKTSKVRDINQVSVKERVYN